MIENQDIAISEKLKDFFTSQGISQQAIAERLRVSQPAVSALLNGKPFGKKLAQKWGDEFGLKPTWLLTGEGEMLKGDTVEPDRGQGCDCPMIKFTDEVIQNMKAVTDMSSRLIEQQAELIAAIRALSERK